MWNGLDLGTEWILQVTSLIGYLATQSLIIRHRIYELEYLGTLLVYPGGQLSARPPSR